MSVTASLKTLSPNTLLLDVTDEVLTITFNRPESLNALSQEVFDDLRAVLSLLREGLGRIDAEGNADWSVRGVILTGAGGRAFVAGADIAQMNEQTPEEIRQFAGEAQELSLWLEELRVPVIAAVDGFALGGGCEMSLACDMIFATTKSSFGQPEVALGLIPGFGGTVRLQRAVGPQLAKDLILSGRRINATEAHKIGLAARLYDDADALIEGAREFFATVRGQSPLAVAVSKQTINRVAPLPYAEGLAVELDAFVDSFGTEDKAEGTAAFVAKRRPVFTGK